MPAEWHSVYIWVWFWTTVAWNLGNGWMSACKSSFRECLYQSYSTLYLISCLNPPTNDRSHLVSRDEPGAHCTPSHESNGRVVKRINSKTPVRNPVINVNVTIFPTNTQEGVNGMPEKTADLEMTWHDILEIGSVKKAEMRFTKVFSSSSFLIGNVLVKA